jgi:hypothetical protein
MEVEMKRHLDVLDVVAILIFLAAIALATYTYTLRHPYKNNGSWDDWKMLHERGGEGRRGN